MTDVTLSNAQSLRVIGQDLNALDINVFNLGRRNDEYTLGLEGREAGKQPTEHKTAFKRIVQAILRRDDFPRKISEPRQFSAAEIFWAHIARGIKRQTSDGVTDLHELSLLLRVLGSYLDKNEADDFIIFWSTDSVKVVYDNKEDNFTMLNLYDLGTSMYLKRSNRRQAN
ncbi:MAG: hypothetical protein ACREQ2_00215 [Candidatus Binatia bacterium]